MNRPRTRSRRIVRPPVQSAHPIGTPSGLAPNTGPLASAAWLAARELVTGEPRWYVEILLDASLDASFDTNEPGTSRFQLDIYSEEWGFCFFHLDRTSWIRVTDIPFVHGRDDHLLLDHTPKLRDIGTLVRRLERRFAIELRRHPPLVRTSLPGAEPAIRDWLATL